MKKVLLPFLSAVAIAVTAPPAHSLEYKTVDNYFEGFDNVQTGSNQSAIGWGRIFDYTPLGAIDYRLEAIGGMADERSTNTNVLSVQWQETWDDETGSVYSTEDMIVTPLVSGKVQFFLSKKGSQASSIPKIKAYKCYRNEDFSFSLGDPIELGDLSITSKEWTQVDFELDAPACVALWMEHCYFDSFSADEAQIPQLRTVQLNGFLADEYAVNADRDGKLEFKLKVRATNRGNLPLLATDDDFTIEVAAGTDVLTTIPVGVDLAPGEETYVNFTLPYQLAYPTKDEQLTLRCIENVSRTVSYTTITLTAKAHVPVLGITVGGQSVSTLNLGLFEGAKEMELKLANTGSAPLEITSITLPTGVTLDIAAPLTLNSGETKTGVLTISPDGTLAGDVVIESNTYGDVKGFSVLGAKVAPGTYTEDFSAGIVPARWIITKSGAWTAQREGVLRSATSTSSAAKAILPKLKITEDSKLIFALTRTTRATYYECFVKVFVSDDRMTWTEIGKISSKDADSAMPDYDSYSFAQFDVPAGEKYLAFEGVYVNIDNIAVGALADISHDIYLHAFSADKTGMVNYPVAAAVTLQNAGPQVLGSDHYAVELLVDGTPVAKLDDAGEFDNAGATTKEFKFSFIPHAVCDESSVSARITAGDHVVESAPSTISITGEVLNTDVLVGTLNVDDELSNIPVRAGDNNSYSEFVYTASQLGLEKGDKIAALSFYYFINAERNPTKTIKVWVENTDLTAPPAPETGKAFADTTLMTRVACKDFLFARTTDRVFDKYSLLTIPFDESFEYDGASLRFIVAQESSDFVAASFLVFRGGSTLWTSDDNLVTAKRATPTKAYFMPAALLCLDKSAPVISGKITDGETPLEGAEVTLESDGVEYYGTTDSEGAFGIAVLQASRSYGTKVAAHAFKDAAFEPSIFAGDTALDDIALASNAPVAESISFDTETATLSWDAVEPGSLDSGVTYTVLLDGETAASGLAGTTHTFAGFIPGEHTIGVCAVFEPTGARSEVAQVKVAPSGIASAAVESVKVSVCTGGVLVEAAGRCEVDVYGVDGRKVAHSLAAGKIALPAGVYVVRAVADRTLTVKVAVK